MQALNEDFADTIRKASADVKAFQKALEQGIETSPLDDRLGDPPGTEYDYTPLVIETVHGERQTFLIAHKRKRT